MPNPKPKSTPKTYGYQPDGTWHFGDCTIDTDGQVEPHPPESGPVPAPRLLWPKPPGIEPRSAGDVHESVLALLQKIAGPGTATRMLGILYAYASSPYLVMHFGAHPGLWLHGGMASGKSTIAHWLAAIYGFGWTEHVSFDNRTTIVGAQRTLAQYSCLPVVFDDYHSDRVPMPKEAIIRGAYDRSATLRASSARDAVAKISSPLTTPIVCGEKPSHDAATRSRFLHVELSRSIRLTPAEMHEMNVRLMKQMHLIGLALLKRHADFGGKVVDLLRQGRHEDRQSFVLAVADYAFNTAHQMLTRH